MSKALKQEARKAIAERPIRMNKAGEIVPLFVKVEKNIVALGFFTPTNPKLKHRREKIIQFDDPDKGVKRSVRILTAGNYGLPGTADLDKYLALLKIITDIKSRSGEVTNPVCFSSSELLKILCLRVCSKNNKEVENWLDRMSATTIITNGAISLDRERHYRKERNRVFDRAISTGRELPTGIVADRNYVWLSDWQLFNINNNYIMPVDLDAYLKLENPLAKTLVPLLQIWLYATRSKGVFEKRYTALCELLGKPAYGHASKAIETFAPALDELKKYEYLSDWEFTKSRNTGELKLHLKHGQKFYRDTSLNLRSSEQPKLLPSSKVNELSAMLKERGVSDTGTHKIVTTCNPQDIEDRIEFIDFLITSDPDKWHNPPGLYYTLILTNTPIPPHFETSRTRRGREEREREERDATKNDYMLEYAYEFEYIKGEVERYLKELGEAEYKELAEEMRAAFKREYPEAAKVYNEENTMAVVMSMVEKRVAENLPLLSFEEFRDQRRKASAN